MSRTAVLAGTTASPSTARYLIRSEMAECDKEAVAAAELMISELVTNALVHGSPPIRIDLHHREEADLVRAAVTDGGDGQPVLRDPGGIGHHGRGLLIVQSMAEEWGFAGCEAGKSVWFTVRCHH